MFYHRPSVCSLVSLIILALLLGSEVQLSIKTSPPKQDDGIVAKLTTPRLKQDDDVVYVWVHIPKTGGTTAYHMFMDALKWKSNYTIYPETNYEKAIFDWNTPGCTAAGKGGSHCARSEILDCIDKGRIILPDNDATKKSKIEYRFMTVVRHPVDRVVSEYYWWRDQQPQAKAWTRSMSRHGTNLTAWILDENNIAHNRQAQHFLMDAKLVDGQKQCTSFLGNQTLEWLNDKYGSVAAFNRLNVTASEIMMTNDNDRRKNKFFFVAVLDSLLESQVYFKQVFGIESGNDSQGEGGTHASAKTQDLSAQDRSLIMERNRLDLLLYNKAKADILSSRSF